MKIELNEHERRMIVIALDKAKANPWDAYDAPADRRIAKREDIMTAIEEIAALIEKFK